MRASKAGAGRRAGQACHRSWNAYSKSQRQELCQFFVYGGEQNCVVDPKICVGDPVAHRSHRGPGNVGVGCFKFLGEMPNGLAHDIVGPHHRITRPFVGQIGLQRHPFNKSDQGATSADDISQKIAIIALSNHKWTASSSTRRPIYGFNASRATRSTLRSTNADSASSSARNSERARGRSNSTSTSRSLFALAVPRATEPKIARDLIGRRCLRLGSATRSEDLVLAGHATA